MARPEISGSYEPPIPPGIGLREKPEIEFGVVTENNVTPEDRADIVRLFLSLDPEPSKEVERDLEAPWPVLWGKQCFVVRDENAAVGKHAPVIGVIHLDIRKRKDKTEGSLSSFALNPKYRGMGIGSPLLDKAIDAARAAGVAELVLDTDELTSKEAKEMYERRGFKAEVWRTKTIRGVTYKKDTHRLVLSPHMEL